MLELMLRPAAISARRVTSDEHGALIELVGLEESGETGYRLVLAERAFWSIVERLGGPGGVRLAAADELARLNGAET